MKHIKKIVKQFEGMLPVLMAVVFIGGALSIMHFAFAATTDSGYLHIPKDLSNSFPVPSGNTGVEIARSLVGKVIDNVRYLIGAIAIIVIIISGVKLVTAGGNEETFTKETTTLTYAIIGLFFVALAGDLATIFNVDQGGFLKDPNVAVQRSRLFNRVVEIAITFIKYVIGSLSVLFIVRNGLRLVLLGGNEDEVTKDKKNLFYGLLGLVVILLSNTVVNNIFFKIDTSKYPGVDGVKPGIDAHALALQIAGITNLVASIAGPFALLSLIVGGVMYMFAAGEEEKIGKAKKLIMWSLIGLVVIYGAFSIVSLFVTRQFQGI